MSLISLSFILFLLVIGFDIASKALITHYIPLIGLGGYYLPFGVSIFENFFGIDLSIVHTTNKGAAWGVLAEYQKELLLFRIALILCMGIYLAFINKNKSFNHPLTLVLAGAVGNVIDYFIYGHVVDMIHVVLWGYDFPVFNLADSAITIGIIWMCLLSWLEKPRKKMKFSQK